MKKLLSLAMCLLLIASLLLPVLAADIPVEYELDTEEILSEEGAVAAAPDDWGIGGVDGEEIVVYGSVIPPEATHTSSPMPAWILLILVILIVLLTAGALVAVIVILVILVIAKAARKRETDTPETENNIPEVQD